MTSSDYEKFQSTLPRRERHIPHEYHQQVYGFQSTLPRRERQVLRKAERRIAIFQSTLPRRERRGHCCRERRGAQFQSTLPRRERRLRGQFFPHQLKDFNPRSREGSDRDFPAPGVPLYKISIHAPAKGATLISSIMSHGMQFQSTLPRRERLSAPCIPAP